MKKKTAIVLGTVMAFSLSVPVLAETVQPPLLTAQAAYQLKVNGESVEGQAYEKGELVMVPLRSVSEALGFTVVWNEEAQTIDMDNGSVKTTITIGEDLYFKASSEAVGLTDSLPLGAAPELREDRTYVPAGLFHLLYSSEQAVKIEGNIISIDVPQKVEIPSPMSTYATPEEAQEALGRTYKLPAVLPRDYTLESVQTIAGEVLQIEYSDGKNQISYRTAFKDGDISGDYNSYETEKQIEVNSVQVTLKGNGDKFFGAVWTEDGFSYAVYAENGLKEQDLCSVIENIK